jgi:hypothetical protein
MRIQVVLFCENLGTGVPTYLMQCELLVLRFVDRSLKYQMTKYRN